MALISPSGIATIIAMIAPMKTVPQKSGIAPNAPEEPAWSARIAVCGLQVDPKRNSTGETMLKKRSDSKSKREDDPERGQDRDQRGEQERHHHQPLDPGPGPEGGADPAVGEGAAGEGEEKRRDRSDQPVAG